MSANEWLKVIDKHIKSRADVIPKGFYSRREIEKIWNVSKGEANLRLRDLIEQGIVETKYFKIKETRGIVSIRHFKIKCTN